MLFSVAWFPEITLPSNLESDYKFPNWNGEKMDLQYMSGEKKCLENFWNLLERWINVGQRKEWLQSRTIKGNVFTMTWDISTLSFGTYNCLTPLFLYMSHDKKVKFPSPQLLLCESNDSIHNYETVLLLRHLSLLKKNIL